jgi:hypothetical protein
MTSHPIRQWAILLLCSALVTLLFRGCAPKVYDDPVAKMMDRTDAPGPRLAAARQAEQQMPDDPDRLAALKKLTVSPRHPAQMRTFAIDSLIRHDEAAAKAFLRNALPRMNSWPAMEQVIDAAVDRNWTDFTPALVRNLGRPARAIQDRHRPERAALLTLNPNETLEQIAFGVMTADPNADVRERAGAWAMLNRLTDDRDALMAKLASVDVVDDPLIVDLKAAATDLHVTADSLESITWLQMFRSPLYAGFWGRAKAAVATLTPAQKQGLALRHLALVVHLHETQPAALRPSRDELFTQVSRLIRSQKHHYKSADYDGHSANHPQRFTEWADELTWADLLVMQQITQLMGNRAVVDAWFTQADADLKDKSTEYGGLLEWDRDGRLLPSLYKPTIRQHDLKYYAPKSLTLNGYAAFAHYHFHAQTPANAKWAGPGRGDLDRVADTQRYTGLVLTFVNADALNVDYYRQGRVVVDMGTVSR